jgi:hypothetical protein
MPKTEDRRGAAGERHKFGVTIGPGTDREWSLRRRDTMKQFMLALSLMLVSVVAYAQVDTII